MQVSDSQLAIINQLQASSRVYAADLALQLQLPLEQIAETIDSLQALGLSINKLPEQCYQLSQPISLLDQAYLQAALPKQNPQIAITSTSTNDWARQQANNVSDRQLYTCELQTQGRGRRGNVWHASFAGQLTFSQIVHLKQGLNGIEGLSLAVGLAVVEALQSLGFQELQLKWPNDIYYKGKKLAGILIELDAVSSVTPVAIIGIGINVASNQSLQDRVDQQISYLQSSPQQYIDRNSLLATIVKHLDKQLDDFFELGFAVLQNRWNSFDLFAGKTVTLSRGANIYHQGICCGVNSQGQLKLEIDGELIDFNAGELSLRSK